MLNLCIDVNLCGIEWSFTCKFKKMYAILYDFYQYILPFILLQKHIISSSTSTRVKYIMFNTCLIHVLNICALFKSLTYV